MDLISSALKTEMATAMQNIFDSFKRTEPITFYKTAAQTVTVHDPDFNADFDVTENTIASQSQSFYCRVWPEERQEFSTNVEGGDFGVNTRALYNRIRIQMESDAFEYLKDTEVFIWYDEKYRLEESWKRIGILGTVQFYEAVLRRVN